MIQRNVLRRVSLLVFAVPHIVVAPLVTVRRRIAVPVLAVERVVVIVYAHQGWEKVMSLVPYIVLKVMVARVDHIVAIMFGRRARGVMKEAITARLPRYATALVKLIQRGDA